ncbi:Isochorismate synthase MenF [Candidatus Entotheonellaceae bacterium PAL068K]
MTAIHEESYRTQGGIEVHRSTETLQPDGAVEPIIDALDERRGVLLASSYEYPGRYTRWEMGFIDPPLEIMSRHRDFQITALNARGTVLLPTLAMTLEGLDATWDLHTDSERLTGSIRTSSEPFPEELRSKQPSVFSLLRAVRDLFFSPEDTHLGLYGAFAYDLALQFEPLRLRLERPADQRDLVLFLPDDLIIVDHRRAHAARYRYEFDMRDASTRGLPRQGVAQPYVGATTVARSREREPGEYADCVRQAKAYFKRGDLFEVVPSLMLYEPCSASPSEIFRRLRERNPAPYGFIMNLGHNEYLVGASPEMYVRVDGDRLETCPISGTIARGQDPIGDAAQILELLNSEKDTAELTMCTDVDRNDKSRVCVPGSVRVIGRRQIEIYSRLIHTVDHVEGRLRPGFDALDAFLTHTWAVTVTGAPKAWAMQFIEDHERSARAWYGGAVGLIGFDGNMNTGLTLRTIRIKEGVAEVRAGSTLLYDSDPEAEERECYLKASAFIDAIHRPRSSRATASVETRPRPAPGKRLLLVDHQDSFVHTLANYFRQTGAEVETLRAGFPLHELAAHQPDLVVLSPGPGCPNDFAMGETIAAVLKLGLPIFGVCLGLQGIVEYFGGTLGTLPEPMHGKPSHVRILAGRLFDHLPTTFTAGRYHSLFANKKTLPDVLVVTAEADDGIVMAVEHRELPVTAVQFHPESIMSLDGNVGIQLIRNVVTQLVPAVPAEAG